MQVKSQLAQRPWLELVLLLMDNKTINKYRSSGNEGGPATKYNNPTLTLLEMSWFGF